MPDTAFLAADWGTSNLRAWRIGPSGEVEAEERFPWGVAKIAPGEAAERLKADIRPGLHAEDLPAVMCGMIGSNLGIAEVPYLECPAGLAEVKAALHLAGGQTPPLRIAPGLRCRRANGDPDVMRGEETKLLGWISLDPARSRGRHVLVLPGTHNKWVVVEDGKIARFVTCMSGELFDLMSNHGVLKSDKADLIPEAFDAGLERGGESGALAAKLFTGRSRVVGGVMPKSWTRDYLSGLLLADEVANMPAMIGAPDLSHVELLGDPPMCEIYSRALAARNITTRSHLADEAVLAGLKALHQEGEAA